MLSPAGFVTCERNIWNRLKIFDTLVILTSCNLISELPIPGFNFERSMMIFTSNSVRKLFPCAAITRIYFVWNILFPASHCCHILCVDELVCIEHYAELCECAHSNKVLRYRYTLEELPHMIHQLRVRAEMYDSWSTRAKSALTAAAGEKLCK